MNETLQLGRLLALNKFVVNGILFRVRIATREYSISAGSTPSENHRSVPSFAFQLNSLFCTARRPSTETELIVNENENFSKKFHFSSTVETNDAAGYWFDDLL